MTVCVFGASGTALDQKYITAVEQLGTELAKRGHSLMFGGGTNGLMGAAARGFKAGNGRIKIRRIPLWDFLISGL